MVMMFVSIISWLVLIAFIINKFGDTKKKSFTRPVKSVSQQHVNIGEPIILHTTQIPILIGGNRVEGSVRGETEEMW